MDANRSCPSREVIYTFDHITTTQFIPGEDYIRRCIKSDPVLRFLEKSRFRAPIYIITGVKIVAGATAKSGDYSDLGATSGAHFNRATLKTDLLPLGGR